MYGDLLGNLRGLVQLLLVHHRQESRCGIGVGYAYARAVELGCERSEDKFTATLQDSSTSRKMDELFEHPRRPFYISDRISKLNEAFDQDVR